MTDKIDITGIDSDLVEKSDIKNFTKGILKNKKISISVSVNEDLEYLGFSEQHLNDISIEIARYIIANDGTALYGGDLRVGGFTYYFSELSNQYKKSDDNSLKYINYFIFPNTKHLTKDVRIDFASKQIGIVQVDPPRSITIDFNREYFPNKNIEDRYLYCECFREMRKKMAEDSDARILVGGKLLNYLGYLPGVIEEGLYTLNENKPLYLIGAFGGATQKLIQLIEGHDCKELSNEFQYHNEFLSRYKQFIKDKYEYYDYDALKNSIREYTIKKLSDINNLSIVDNRILFYSKNIHEITHILMKGLKSSFSK